MTSSDFLQAEQQWLAECINSRIEHSKKNASSDKNIFEDIPPVTTSDAEGEYAQLIKRHSFNAEERLLLALSLCNHYNPRLLTVFLENIQLQFAARVIKAENLLSVLPTAETFFFIAGGNSGKSLTHLHRYFDTSHPFYKESILDLGIASPGVSRFDAPLLMPPTARELLLYDKYQPPRFSNEFPAQLLSTKLEWKDLVLMPQTQQLLNELKNRLLNEADVRTWKTNTGRLGDHMRPGIRVLLFGASGQGKTLTTSLLGKLLEREVYRIDLSSVISKYIGETSKNLRNLFDTAERKKWILFIDEGDALLGMRSDLTANSGSTAQHANQDVAYILQRIENFDGFVVVATNLANNIDAAFERRFEGRIRYAPLNTELQVQVWKNTWPEKLLTDTACRIDLLLSENPLSPASIVNVIQRIAFLAAEQNNFSVKAEMIRQCIMDEAIKYKGRNSPGF